ncbi:hypothetical protein [Kitasatospora sp. NBC_01539]|uniref:hypothetical protein n=1 Tax=Kitasatospora sp. NBC_01539 TaxID=2903577 RepID=UPI00386008FB
MVQTELPESGLVFWPVGTGDSTTIVVDENTVVQVDLHDMKSADEDDAVVAAVIDRLEETLPRPDGETPYLALFALTHADLDHCGGFADLLDSSILIGEIWATPRLWRELSDDTEMCEDARRFQEEVERRVQATLAAVEKGHEPASGDRVLIIGYDDDRELHSYSELPDAYFTGPGHTITSIDGVSVSDRFEAFVHAPFHDDCAGERNDTSLALQIQLRHPDGTVGRALLLGDLAYPTIKKIFDYSEGHNRADRLAWDVLLSPHHCSKKVMYATGEDGTEERKQDILDQLADHASDDAYIVASARPFRDEDKTGDNPPHLLAKEAYEEITSNPILCTGEYPTEEAPHPVVFALEPGEGLVLQDVEELEEARLTKSAGQSGGWRTLAALGATVFAVGAAAAAARRRAQQIPQQGTTDRVGAAVRQARGDEAAPVDAVGFGRQ